MENNENTLKTLLVCAETILKGFPMANKGNTQYAGTELHFYVRAITRHCNASESELGGTGTEKTYAHFTLSHHTQNLA